MPLIFPSAVLVSCVAAVAGKTQPLSSAAAAEAFNKAFEGRGAGKGVYMRATEEIELFCGGACHGTGYPDCTMSAMFWNHIAGVDSDGHLHARIPMVKHQAGIVFNAEMMEKTLARCYYATNAVSRTRYNGGCGCQAPEEDRECKIPHCPFHNIGHDGHYVDGDHSEATKCMCKDYGTVVPNDPCFWRGPAYNTSKGKLGLPTWISKNKEGRYGSNEVESFIKQRKTFQEKFSVAKRVWDEVVMDVHGLKAALEHDPAAAIEGFYYFTAPDLPVATKLQSSFHSKYGVELPIVRVDDENKVSSSKGPFVAHSHSLDSASFNVGEEPVVV